MSTTALTLTHTLLLYVGSQIDGTVRALQKHTLLRCYRVQRGLSVYVCAHRVTFARSSARTFNCERISVCMSKTEGEAPTER